MQVKLTPRLLKVAEQVEAGSRVADIGTDHGYIPLYLVEKKIAPFAIACDVNAKPLEAAQKNIQAAGYQGQIETRLGDGLTNLVAGEVDTIIIAGMGGQLIKQILEISKNSLSRMSLILQPMQARKHLRKYLLENGFIVKRDLLVKEDHRIYEILVAEQGTSRPVADPLFYEIGVDLKSNPLPLAMEFIRNKIRATERMLTQMEASSDPLLNEKEKRTQERLCKLKEVLQWLQS